MRKPKNAKTAEEAAPKKTPHKKVEMQFVAHRIPLSFYKSMMAQATVGTGQKKAIRSLAEIGKKEKNWNAQDPNSDSSDPVDVVLA